jgi:hypothetical protein
MIAYPVFRAALDGGDLRRVIELAKQMPPMRLDDALRVCLLLRDDPDRFERAAVRWLGRYALEGRAVTIEDVQQAAGALDALPAAPDAAMARLQAICVRTGVG